MARAKTCRGVGSRQGSCGRTIHKKLDYCRMCQSLLSSRLSRHRKNGNLATPQVMESLGLKKPKKKKKKKSRGKGN
ncbi:hypothetical protein ACFL2B_02910 [Patescibacteria group bacterium]